jgi:Putative MetA-pathway of phenol degradation
MKKIFIVLIISILSNQMSHAQQAWTKEKGKFYSQIGTSFLSYNALLNEGKENLPIGRTVSDVTIQGYAEYGITDRFMVSASLPLKLTSVSNAGNANIGKDGNLAGLGNIQTALTANLFKKNGFVVAAKGTIDFATAQFDIKTGLRTGFDATTFAPSLLVGYGHSKFFTSAEMGYAIRNNGYSNRTFAAAQVGRSFGKKKNFMAILGADFMQSANGGTYDDASSAFTGLYLNKQSYLAYHLKLAYKITPKIKAWLATGTGVGSLNRNVAATPSYSLSISYQND